MKDSTTVKRATRRKFTFRTREAAETAAKNAERDAFTARLALTAVLTGWPSRSVAIKAAPFTAIIVGAGRCDGGIVALKYDPKLPGNHASVTTHYVDDWCAEIAARPMPYMTEDPEFHTLRQLAHDVRYERDRLANLEWAADLARSRGQATGS